MDEFLHNDVDKIFTDTLQKHKHDVPGDVWIKIDAELDKEDKRISNRRRQQFIKNSLWAIPFLGVLISITTFQFRNDLPTFKSHLPVGQASIDSKIGSSDGTKNSPVVSSQAADAPKSATTLIKKQRIFNLNAATTDKQVFAANRVLTDPSGRELPESNMEMKSYHSVLSLQERDKSMQPIVIKNILFTGQSRNHLIVKHDKQNIKNRFSITPYFSQEFAGYDLTDNNDAYGPNGKVIEEKERNVFSASAGFYINYNFKKRWVIQSGLSYSWSRSNIDSSTSYAVKDNNGHVQFKVNTVSGYGYLKPGSAVPPAIGDSVSTAKTYSELHYLSMPLLLSYNFPMKKFSLLVGAGITVNMLTSAGIETKTYGPGNPEKEYAVSMLGLKKSQYGCCGQGRSGIPCLSFDRN